MKQIKVFSLFFILSLQLFAGQSTGNGGDVIVCKENGVRTTELLDIYEGSLHINDNIYFLEDIQTPIDVAIALADRIRSENLSNYYKEKIKYFMTRVEFVVHDLVDIPDSNHIYIPSYCEIKQIAINKIGASVKINRELWNSLDIIHRGALIMHELLYEDAIKAGFANSQTVRKQVYLLLINNANIIKDFAEAAIDQGVIKEIAHCNQCLLKKLEQTPILGLKIKFAEQLWLNTQDSPEDVEAMVEVFSTNAASLDIETLFAIVSTTAQSTSLPPDINSPLRSLLTPLAKYIASSYEHVLFDDYSNQYDLNLARRSLAFNIFMSDLTMEEFNSILETNFVSKLLVYHQSFIDSYYYEVLTYIFKPILSTYLELSEDTPATVTTSIFNIQETLLNLHHRIGIKDFPIIYLDVLNKISDQGIYKEELHKHMEYFLRGSKYKANETFDHTHFESLFKLYYHEDFELNKFHRMILERVVDFRYENADHYFSRDDVAINNLCSVLPEIAQDYDNGDFINRLSNILVSQFHSFQSAEAQGHFDLERSYCLENYEYFFIHSPPSEKFMSIIFTWAAQESNPYKDAILNANSFILNSPMTQVWALNKIETIWNDPYLNISFNSELLSQILPLIEDFDKIPEEILNKVLSYSQNNTTNAIRILNRLLGESLSNETLYIISHIAKFSSSKDVKKLAMKILRQ